MKPIKHHRPPGLPGDLDSSAALTIDEVALELHTIMAPAGFKTSAQALGLRLALFAKRHGPDYPARLLAMARIERKYERSLACVVADLNGTGKQFVPHCHRHVMATAGEEAANA
jgi:hypothetical protein